MYVYCHNILVLDLVLLCSQQFGRLLFSFFCSKVHLCWLFCDIVAVLTLSSSDDAGVVFGGSVSRFVEDSEFMYEDFSRRGERSTISTFRASDFSWEDYGFSLGNGLYTDIGTLLDDKFNVVQNLTYNT